MLLLGDRGSGEQIRARKDVLVHLSILNCELKVIGRWETWARLDLWHGCLDHGLIVGLEVAKPGLVVLHILVGP